MKTNLNGRTSWSPKAASIKINETGLRFNKLSQVCHCRQRSVSSCPFQSMDVERKLFLELWRKGGTKLTTPSPSRSHSDDLPSSVLSCDTNLDPRRQIEGGGAKKYAVIREMI
ncbi:hypothetical protein AVEN_74670-1 [Araneus ventricosus]|uniref:Uncharacterized protein n=1 Tax=Araneus ventricosus TaxID=182803 RepID=A0A4Y2WXA6_ARAVE|nr:hypothetical protein AVEN_74670-1 [Araneus ventricosus]